MQQTTCWNSGGDFRECDGIYSCVHSGGVQAYEVRIRMLGCHFNITIMSVL